jgi:hypothetical protein
MVALHLLVKSNQRERGHAVVDIFRIREQRSVEQGRPTTDAARDLREFTSHVLTFLTWNWTLILDTNLHTIEAHRMGAGMPNHGGSTRRAPVAGSASDSH